MFQEMLAAGSGGGGGITSADCYSAVGGTTPTTINVTQRGKVVYDLILTFGYSGYCTISKNGTVIDTISSTSSPTGTEKDGMFDVNNGDTVELISNSNAYSVAFLLY